jgi:hypothetical protein
MRTSQALSLLELVALGFTSARGPFIIDGVTTDVFGAMLGRGATKTGQRSEALGFAYVAAAAKLDFGEN